MGWSELLSTGIWRRKSVESAIADGEKKELARVLGLIQVLAVGIGEIIGAGIFVLTGIFQEIIV
jgi:APA family basic amino acid/polyamine antiporter